MPIQLPPHGSTFVVFRKAETNLPSLRLVAAADLPGPRAARVDAWDGRRARLTMFTPGRYQITTEDGRRAESPAAALPKPRRVQGPWTVTFTPGRGAPASTTFDRLTSWTEHADTGIRYFSGNGTYRCSFDLPEAWLASDRRVFLDLGDLWAVGDVSLNGKPLGVLWSPPFFLDLTEAAAVGQNTLVVEISNTWANRLVGDAIAPSEKRFTRTNVLHNNGKRWKDTALLRSGLFGPVHLVSAATVTVEPR
jgi:hypothetical protein